jgi:hypothetical protein
MVSEINSLRNKQHDLEAVIRKQDETICKLYEDNMFFKSKLLSLANLPSQNNEVVNSKCPADITYTSNESQTIVNPIQIEELPSRNDDHMKNLNNNGLSENIIEVITPKGCYENKNKTLIEQSNKNRNSNSKARFNHVKNRKYKRHENISKCHTSCPFLSRRGWCAKGNRCDFMHPKPLHRQYVYPSPLHFPQRNSYFPTRNCETSSSSAHYRMLNPGQSYSNDPFLYHHQRPTSPIPLMKIQTQPPFPPFRQYR